MEKKCKEFEINSENSDAECFVGEHIESEGLVNKNPLLCEICVYNQKYKGIGYNGWITYRKKIGIPPKQ